MNFISLVIIFPLFGFIILALSQGKWPRSVSAVIGVGSIGASVCMTAYIIFNFLCNAYIYNNNFVFVQELWTWFSVNDLRVTVSFRLDALSIIMLTMVTGIGLIIHIYASWYMYREEGYSRFFAYTNLFMFNMIILVLSDNLLLMYFGWEGVGFCSYLLIGFYYFNSKNGIAAFKAFIMTRCGDICLICALFMIYDQYHTLSISELLRLYTRPTLHYLSNNFNWMLCMLLIAAIAKSAQFPLQTWLISAMVGPTPVSALIHAATMVASGVYLINRMNYFFVLSPNVLYFIGIIGAITLIFASCSALLQNNIKKILAYSTISQIGYMFLSLGGGHWVASIFHLLTHAVCKALLFLASGSLVYICSKEQNIFKMGGLYKSTPLLYICFLVGGASLAAVPIFTSGFYSKELILLNTLISRDYFFWISGLIGAFLTPIYIFRMIFIIFHGQKKINPYLYENNFFQNFPLIFLLLLSTFIGSWIYSFLSNIFLDTSNVYGHKNMYFEIISGILVIFGIWVASYFWLYTYCTINNKNSFCRETIMRYIIVLCYYGWGFDKIYRIIFMKSYLYVLDKLYRFDVMDVISNTVVSCFSLLKYGLKYSVNGKLNWYIISINIGVIFILILLLCVVCMHDIL